MSCECGNFPKDGGFPVGKGFCWECWYRWKNGKDPLPVRDCCGGNQTQKVNENVNDEMGR